MMDFYDSNYILSSCVILKNRKYRFLTRSYVRIIQIKFHFFYDLFDLSEKLITSMSTEAQLAFYT